MSTYLITYIAYNSIDVIIKEGSIKVKNQDTEIGAKVNLEKYLKKKYKYFNKLVITKCEIDFDDDAMNQMFNGNSDKDNMDFLKNMFGMS